DEPVPLAKDVAGAENEQADDEERDRSKHEAADQLRTRLGHDGPASAAPNSPRRRNARTFGSSLDSRSSRGSPLAAAVWRSPSRKMELSAIAKMLASSCVTITTVAERLSRSSR